MTTARRSRGQYAHHAARAVRRFANDVKDCLAEDQIDREALRDLEGEIPEVKESLTALDEAIIKCQVLEQYTDEEAALDPVRAEAEELADQLRKTIGLLRGARSRLAAAAAVPAPAGGQQAGAQAPRVSVKTPPSLAGNTDHKAFRRWRRIWDNYATVTKLADLQQPEQLAQLKSVLSPDFLSQMVHVMGIAENTPAPINEVMDNIATYLRGQRNLALDRLHLFNRRQKGSETFAEYYAALKEAAEDADTANVNEDTLLATLILVGIKDDETRQKLLEEEEAPNLERTRAICQAQEKATRHSSKIASAAGGSDYNPDVNKTNYQRNRQANRENTAQQNKGRAMSKDGGRDKGQCQGCGKRPAHDRRKECPAQGKECKECGKLHHFAKVCRGKGSGSTRSTGTIGSVHAITTTSAKGICNLEYVTVGISMGESEKQLRALPDSGSSANIVGEKVFSRLRIRKGPLRRPADVLTAANGLPLALSGKLTVCITYGDAAVDTDIYISPEHNGALLNKETCMALGILPPDFPSKPRNTVQTVAQSPEDIKAKLLADFEDVFDEEDKPLQAMAGSPMHIELEANAEPVKHIHPRPVPFAMRDEVKNLLDDLVAKGVLAKVEEPTDWIHPMTVVRKPSGKLRLCVDLRGLNKFVKRPHHPIKSPKEAVAEVPPNAHWFSTFDASSGYFQVPLDESSQLLTTFITPWGRYKHLRATMGLSSAGDEYNARGDEALTGITNCTKLVDDVLLFDTDKDLGNHEKRVRQFLERCRSAGITLNPNKVKFAQPEVKFAGYLVGRDGTKADPEKLSAIAAFPTPKNISDVRSFLGLVEQLAGYSTEVSGALGPMRPLLSSKNPFVWTPDHDRAFQATKDALAKPPVLQAFDPSRETALHTDASRLNGLGYILLQKDPGTDRWHLIECGSRFVTPTESRYAMVELELLAITWAVQKLRLYLLGLSHFTLVTDHRPLVGILDRQTLDAVDNGRLKRLKVKLAPYNFTTVWRKGATHKIPDAFSRSPVSKPTPEETKESEELYMAVCATTAVCALEQEETQNRETPEHLVDPTLLSLKEAADVDTGYQSLLDAIQTGFQAPVHPEVKPYLKLRDSMTADAGLALLGHRVVVPRECRKLILQRLHSSHQGIERTLRRARQSVFWPGITSDVKSTVEACEACQLHKPSLPKETLKSDPMPTRVFEEVAADFFEIKGSHYLVIVDRLSGWPQVYPFSAPPTAKSLIAKLILHFTQVGVPVCLRSDGGLQFAAEETRVFTSSWGIRHVLSSPHFPQSNGLAESAVKSVKALLKKTGGFNEAFHEGMLELRNTPRDGGKSPAEIVFGKPLRSRVPAHAKSFDPKWLKSMEDYDASRASIRGQVEERYNKTAKDLPTLPVGTYVRIQNHATKLWDRTGHVVTVGRSRDYRIKMPSGRLLWRNRRFVRPVPSPEVVQEQETSEETSSGFRGSQEDCTATASSSGQDGLRRSRRVRFAPSRLSY